MRVCLEKVQLSNIKTTVKEEFVQYNVVN